MSSQVEIKLVRSPIGNVYWMRTIVKSLGLRKMNQTKIMSDTPQLRGAVRKVQHLVSIKPVEAANG